MNGKKELNVKNPSWKIHFWQTLEGWLLLTDFEKNISNDVIILIKNYIGHISFPYFSLCRCNIHSGKLIRYKINKNNTCLCLKELKI